MMTGYDAIRDRAANYVAAGQVQQQMLSAEIGAKQLKAFKAAGVDMDVLGDPLQVGKYKGELAKLDLKKIGQEIGDHVLGRTVIRTLGSYGGNFMDDLKAHREGKLDGPQKEQYEAMLALVKDGTGYDEAGFIARLKANPLNFASATARDVENVAQWRAGSYQREFQRRDLPEMFDQLKKPGESFTDLSNRLNTAVQKAASDTLDDILGRN